MLIAVLGKVARHGRACLVLGLVAGVALPGVAAALRPYLPEMVALLLLATAFRIGPAAAVESLAALRQSAGVVLIYQLVLPLALAGLLLVSGVGLGPLAVAVMLMLSAPSVTGTPNFAILLGQDPAPALRLLVVGTALLPLTAVPVFLALPALGEIGAVMVAAGRLMAVIGLAAAAGFALRHWGARELGPEGRRALDGATALALAVIVVALMAAIGPALRETPMLVLRWLAAAFAVNFGFQLAALAVFRALGWGPRAVPLAMVAGNRNIALFLVALPAATTDPLLLFIGCYQFPMYLTPILLRRIYGQGATYP